VSELNRKQGNFMRFLGIGDSLDLGALYMELQAAGHEVRVFVGDASSHDTMSGLLTQTNDWRRELQWVRSAGDDGIVVFETATKGDLQDRLRAEGMRVIGGSAFGDRLETDRAFGQEVMKKVGLSVSPTHDFQRFDEAREFLRRSPGRYVYKPSGQDLASGRTFVGQLPDGADLATYLALQERHWPPELPVRFVLMQRLDGVEVGVGAYFDGRSFLEPACLDWEHKRFFPGDLGELTGEMGTLVTYRGAELLFAETLGRLAAPLAASGYCGYVNVNTIVDEAGVHPLELTSRFGYPGFAILRPLQTWGWDAIFRRLAEGRGPTHMPTRDGFALGVVMTVPPFPYAAGYEKLSKGLPIVFSELDDEDRANLHFSEVALQDGQLVTSGSVGYILVVTGRGETASAARQDAYRRVAKVHLPNGRYRTDIGARFIASDEARLAQLGWLSPNRR
jgi:phosphoribosylamine---glycine ligase